VTWVRWYAHTRLNRANQSVHQPVSGTQLQHAVYNATHSIHPRSIHVPAGSQEVLRVVLRQAPHVDRNLQLQSCWCTVTHNLRTSPKLAACSLTVVPCSGHSTIRLVQQVAKVTARGKSAVRHHRVLLRQCGCGHYTGVNPSRVHSTSVPRGARVTQGGRAGGRGAPNHGLCGHLYCLRERERFCRAKMADVFAGDVVEGAVADQAPSEVATPVPLEGMRVIARVRPLVEWEDGETTVLGPGDEGDNTVGYFVCVHMPLLCNRMCLHSRDCRVVRARDAHATTQLAICIFHHTSRVSQWYTRSARNFECHGPPAPCHTFRSWASFTICMQFHAHSALSLNGGCCTHVHSPWSANVSCFLQRFLSLSYFLQKNASISCLAHLFSAPRARCALT
jgi:hypothetical protein